jgi:hypothetical protein
MGRNIMEHNLRERIILVLCKKLKRKVYHTYFYNYYTTIGLMHELKLAGLVSCAIIRSNRKLILTLKKDRELG